MKSIRKNDPIEVYLNKTYPIVVYPEEDGYVAEIEELPGCITQGDTIEEVMARIEGARRGWIEVAYEDGQEIPVPRTEAEYSGKFLIRTPKSLHRQLANTATRQGVSLNQYAVYLLSQNAAIDEMCNAARQSIQEEQRLMCWAKAAYTPFRTWPSSALGVTVVGFAAAEDIEEKKLSVRAKEPVAA